MFYVREREERKEEDSDFEAADSLKRVERKEKAGGKRERWATLF